MGEDPTLTGDLVAEFVTGAQNNSLHSEVGPDGHHLRVGTCCKHFAAYDVEGGAGTPARFQFDAELNARDMWETYMPAFESCVKDAQSSHVMCSYNSIEGVPTCGNKGLLTTILRDQWKWDGFVVSDYDACPSRFCRTLFQIETALPCTATAGSSFLRSAPRFHDRGEHPQ